MQFANQAGKWDGEKVLFLGGEFIREADAELRARTAKRGMSAKAEGRMPAICFWQALHACTALSAFGRR